MMKVHVFFILFLIGGTEEKKDDPCKIAKRLPNFELRLKVFKIDPLKDTPMCDRYQMENSTEWFRSEDGNEMVNNATEMFECGTEYGIYMRGSLPSPTDGIVTRTACLPTIDCSTTKYELKLKNCGQYTAYLLKRPDSCDQAYCFGFGEAGTPPTASTGKPRVTYELEKIVNKNQQELVFKCEFDPIPDPNNLYLYKVFWFKNDHKSALYRSKAVPFRQLHTTHLRNSTGLGGITLGVKISCSIRLYYRVRGPPGPSSERSEKFFAGIEPVNKSYKILRGKNATIQFRLTVPFGCGLYQGKVRNCSLSVELTTPGNSVCSQGIHALDLCGKNVKNTLWNATQSIAVKHKNDINRNVIRTFEIHLKTKVKLGGNPFWNNVEVPTIFINVEEEENHWKEARCYAQSDPHMLSFMGKEFEAQMYGTFTLYKYVDEDGNTNEVQMKVKKCTDVNYCACAIAARASSDIYIIDRCDDSPAAWRFDFMSCVEDLLYVVKKTKDERKYEIHFPTGSYLEVQFGTINAYALELFMNPSSYDHLTSRGLCGIVGSRELISSDGRVMTDKSKHLDFVKSWTVDDADNMLKLPIGVLQTRYNKTKKSHDICICNKSDPNISSILEEITCTSAKEYGRRCNDEADVSPVQKGTCYERHKRRRRSAKHHITYIPNNFIDPIPVRVKRSTKVVMTKPEAETWCQNFMSRSPGYEACKNVPNVKPERAVEICVLDMLATNTTEWAIVPREGLKAACMKELLYNDTLKNESDGGIPIVQKIKSVNCPMECSGNGICQNGTCECYHDYGGGDCSINLNEPPFVFAINHETGGLCDVNFCKEAIVIGDLFLNRPDLMCKMQRFQISYGGDQTTLETSFIQGDHNTISDIRCSFPHVIEKRSTTTDGAFITGYRVSVSNNNRNYSSSHLMFILDSTCQDSVNVSGKHKFVLKPGYCFIRGSCVRDGYRKGCNSCNSLRDTFDWTYLDEEKECSTKKNYLWIIGIVLAVLLVIIAALLILMILKKKYRVVRDVPFTPSVEPADKTPPH